MTNQSLANAFLKRFRNHRAQKRFTNRHRFRSLPMEQLEDRRVLATWSGTLSADTTWSNDEVQQVTGNLTVAPDVTLTVEPGTIVKFQRVDVSLFVNGTLDAQGTESQKITFTSIRDDIGEDTNGDAAATSPVAGDWARIIVNGTANITHANIRYGGYFHGMMVHVNGGGLSLSNSEINDSASDGVRTTGGDPLLENNIYRDNADAAISMNLNSNPTVTGVTMSGNAINGLQVDSGGLVKDLTWDDPDVVYWLNDDVVVPKGKKLSINAGQTVKPAYVDAELHVFGTLDVSGTADNPVIFTAKDDDSRGGDTNGDGAASSPAAGRWARIRLHDDSTGNMIDYLETHYGGYFHGHVLAATDTDVSISNSSFVNSAADGVRLHGTDAVLTDNTFTNNADAAISMNLTSNPEISGVTIQGNGINGLQVDSGTIGKDLIWDDPDIVYWLHDDVAVPVDTKLEIGAGQIVKSRYVDTELTVSGTLSIDGTDAAPVVFTSGSDDTHGGDTNGNADATVPTPGDWARIRMLESSKNNSINYLESYYGGYFHGHSLQATVTDLSITNSVFSMSAADGVRLRGTDAVMTDNTFIDNADAAISMNLSSNPDINGVTIERNAINGLQVDSGSLGKDLTWDDPDIVYWLDDDVIVPVDNTFEIAAGQIVKSGYVDTEIHVAGTLLVTGTETEPVIITAGQDDTHGGDTNGDGGDSSPAKGSWARIRFQGTSTGNNINYLESHFGGYFHGHSLEAIDTDLIIANSTFADSGADGVRLKRTDATLTNNSFIDNNDAAISMDLSSNPNVSGVTVSGNGINGLQVDSGTLGKDLTWDDPDIVLWLNDDVNVPAGITLQIDAGQIVKPAYVDTEIHVSGKLNINGTASAPVIFTSKSDDSRGGDTNGDQDASAPTPGDWARIRLLDPSSENTINYLESYYGGYFHGRSLEAINTDLTITNSTFGYSAADAVRLGSTDATLTDNVYKENVGAAVSMDLKSNPTISGATTVSNGINGLRVDAGSLTKDLTWDDPDIVYWLPNDVHVPNEFSLTINAGQIIKLAYVDAEVIVDGTLDVNGTADDPVVFTSANDDERGGDTNGNGIETVPSPADWARVVARSGSSNNSIDHARFYYGGYFHGTNILVSDSPLSIGNTWIGNSASSAISATNNATVAITNSVIANNGDSGIVASLGADVTAINNTVVGNKQGVVARNAGTSVELVNNLVTATGDSAVGVSIADAELATRFNNVFVPDGKAYDGIDDPTGTDGNLSADPMYVDAFHDDFSLGDQSAAVDAADGSLAPETDFLSNTRLDDPSVANTGIGTPDFADIGAIERDRWFSEITSPLIAGTIIAGDNLRLSARGNASPQPIQYDWDFGDGRTANTEVPGIVKFSTIGTQTLTFQAVGADGTPDPEPDTVDITVVDAPTTVPDLNVIDIELPAGLSVGQLNEINYTVENIGNADLADVGWTDALYLSDDPFLDSGDALLGSNVVNLELFEGESYDGSISAVLAEHLFVGGLKYLVVSVDDNWEILERHQLNNEKSLPTTAAIPTLTSDVAVDGAFQESASGQFFQIPVKAGNNLIAVLNDLNDQGVNELYVRFNAPPTRGHYDFRSTDITTADQQLIVPAPAPGTWFILAYGASVPDDGAYTLLATTEPVSLLDVTPDHHGNSVETTITIAGAGFRSGAKLELVNDDGNTFTADSTEADSFTSLTATFSESSVPAGIYDVRVTVGGTEQTLVDAFEFIEGGKAELEFDLIAPSVVGYHQLATFFVEYANVGDVAMPAPLIGVTGDQNGRQAALLTLNSENLSRGFWTPSIPEGFSNSVQFLASGETPGVLQPGETGRMPIYYAGWQQPWDFSYPPVDFFVGALTVDDTTPIDWAAVKDDMQPQTVNAGAWEAIWANFTSQIGSTAGELVRVLGENAVYLARLGLPLNDIGELAAFEVQQADGLLDTAYLEHTIDIETDAPGLLLHFDRFYQSKISGRYAVGSLGRGWTHNWEIMLTEDASNNVTITGIGPGLRSYQPDSRGGYFARGNDKTDLQKLGDGSYILDDTQGITYAFSTAGQLTSVKDRNNNQITTEFSDGNLTALTHSNGQSIAFSYDGNNRISRVDDGQGWVVNFTYDSSGEHLASVSGPAGTHSYAYLTGQGPAKEHALSSVSRADGTQSLLAYDEQGRLSEVAATGGTQPLSYTYDSVGNITVADALGASSTISINQFGKIARAKDGLNRTVHFKYDGLGYLSEVTQPDGNRWTYDYHKSGGLKSVVDPLGAENQVSFDSQLNLPTSNIDPLGNQWDFSYDASGNLVKRTDPTGNSVSFTYDAQGNPLTLTNARGQTTTYTYDSNGRLLTKTQDGTSLASYTYDGRGNNLNAIDRRGETTAYQYDDADRMTRIEDSDGRFLSITYDDSGRRSKVVDQSGMTIQYHYDALSQLSRLSDGSGKTIVEYRYDAVGRPILQSNANGTYTVYEYNNGYDITRIAHYAPDDTIQSSYEYTYDASGRRTGLTTVTGEWTWQYDAKSQLVSATGPNGTFIDFQYDAAGNRSVVSDSGVETKYTVNELNQYTEINGVTYLWDADGNLLEVNDGGVKTTYTYDSENRLLSIDEPGTLITYEYNANGDRMAVTINGDRVEYFVDPAGLGNVVGTYDKNGDRETTFTYGADNSLVVRTDSSDNPFFYSYDGTASTVGITDSSGAVVNQYSYDPFGPTVTLFEAFANPFQFIGEFGVQDDASGLDFMRNRYYDSATGRFVSQDPLGFAGGSPNLYTYVGNDPLHQIDPNGDQILIGIGIAVFVTGVTAVVVAPFVSTWSQRHNAIGRGDYQGAQRATNLLPPVSRATEQGLKFPAAIDHPFVSVPSTVSEVVDAATKKSEKNETESVNEQDPNEKHGPGWGEQGYVAAGDVLAYRVDFENHPEATAPAQLVTIVDPLASEFDWATFELTEIGFGDVVIPIPPDTQHYETSVSMTATSGKEIDVQIEAGIRLDQGEVFARFVSIDPTTELPPDVRTGFLPPEDETGRGKGYFAYTIKHDDGLASGTEIRNIAEITFGFNATIATNQVDPLDPSKGTDPAKEALITIDADSPTSSITPLPEAVRTGNFTIQLSGEDIQGGSGISSYDIYVSKDKGPFELLVGGITEDSHEFTGGESGSSYAFISVARDNVGNRETMPTDADTLTLVMIGAWVNPELSYDVDDNDAVTALDALTIINELERRRVSDQKTSWLIPLPPTDYAPPFYDVNGDGKVTALDALDVINQLPLYAKSQAAEAESHAYDDRVFSIAPPDQTSSEWNSSPDRTKELIETVAIDTSKQLVDYKSNSTPSHERHLPDLTMVARHRPSESAEDLDKMISLLAHDVTEARSLRFIS